MLSVNCTEQTALDYNGHDFNPDSDATGIRPALDKQVSVNPVVERFGNQGDADLTVLDAARVYRKSPRQIQRLLKGGYLTGYKIVGPKGPEWRVSRIQNGPKPVSGEEAVSVTKPTFELNAKVDIMARDLQVLKLKAERFEAVIARIDNLVSRVERLQSDVSLLKEQTSRHEAVVKELHMLREQQSMIEFVSTEVRQHREVLKDLTDKPLKPSWWKRAFSM